MVKLKHVLESVYRYKLVLLQNTTDCVILAYFHTPTVVLK